MTGTDLIPVNGRVPLTAGGFARAERAIGQLATDEDVDTLHQLSVEAQIQALYQRRCEHLKTANEFARLKVLAEAAIGAIDRERNHYGTRRTVSLVVQDVEIVHPVRGYWRLCAVAERRGLLRPLLDQMSVEDDAISTKGVVSRLHASGANWIPKERVIAAVRRSGISLAEVRRQTGVGGWASAGSANLSWDKAEKIASVIGVDPCEWPPSARTLSYATRKRIATQRWLSREAVKRETRAKAAERHGGNIAEAFSLLRKCAQVIDPAEHDFSSREAKVHVRSAYEYLRKAEDEIAQALGVA